MKLLHCRSCDDMLALHGRWRRCGCGQSWGRYSGRREVETIGPCRVLGLSNDALRMADGRWWEIPNGSEVVRHFDAPVGPRLDDALRDGFVDPEPEDLSHSMTISVYGTRRVLPQW